MRQERDEVQQEIETNKKIADDEDENPEIRERAREKVNEAQERLVEMNNEIERHEERLDEGLSLKEK